jgi:hypothetical protein
VLGAALATLVKDIASLNVVQVVREVYQDLRGIWIDENVVVQYSGRGLEET